MSSINSKSVALQTISCWENGEKSVRKNNNWLHYLTHTKETHINLERIISFRKTDIASAIAYTKRTLIFLEKQSLSDENFFLLEEVLKWSEVAKGGTSFRREYWRQHGFFLSIHNIGSAQIYHQEIVDKNVPASSLSQSEKQLAEILIRTHGLIGQYLRGEVPFSHNHLLFDLIKSNKIDSSRLTTLLLALNACIIQAVDVELWNRLESSCQDCIKRIVGGQFQEPTLSERLHCLRQTSIAQGECFDLEYSQLKKHQDLHNQISDLIKNTELWYVEAALYDFSFKEFIVIFLLIAEANIGCSHISFEPLMQNLYYEYNGKKHINLYKKRIIENYLKSLDWTSIHQKIYENPHVKHFISKDSHTEEIIYFDFQFSPAGEKLIDFCVEAEKANILYEQAVLLLFDYFELRRDAYDRFHNEERYLSQMNQSMQEKHILLEYLTNGDVVDIGPGGGGLMDMICSEFPEKKVIGVDFSQNVVETLLKRKNLEKTTWDIRFGDALHLSETFPSNHVGNVIFCSVLHELFSYIETDGKKFNSKTLEITLQSAFSILAPGGRILIRDGIKTEPEDGLRIIRFKSAEGMHFLQKYTEDFQGRPIEYTITGHNEVQMPINDAMEFLYTYTWGEESYVHEVQEQFGYFTPSEFNAFLSRIFGSKAQIIEARHFLQEGYTTALSPKIDFLDETKNPIQLPDSTCVFVIEKKVASQND